jgi:leucine dehydrogenase
MSLFETLATSDHEQVVYCYDKPSGLKAIIAIHDTTLGPALGGCRMYPYAKEADALEDVLRLSRGMTYKNALANLRLGGGKTVIIGDPRKIASEALFKALGRFVHGLNGRYITAEDIGTTPEFMTFVRAETKHVVGIPLHLGGTGNPSPVTAHGTFMGIKAGVKKRLGQDDFKGVTVAVEGVGSVGYHLCKELYEAGAKLVVSDVSDIAVQRAVKAFNAKVALGRALYQADADVYAPCALGATLNDETIPLLKCAIIAGAANNQLKEEVKHSQALRDRGILYAPDYVVNAGGVIHVYPEIVGGGTDKTWDRVNGIYDTLLDIFEVAEQEKITTAAAANRVAEKRIAETSKD